MELFPMIGQVPPAQKAELPLLREVVWQNGKPLFRGGKPVVVEGAQAIQLWVATVLGTPRFHHGIYEPSFGSEIKSLVGRQFDNDIKTAEVPRMLRDCLLINPYITSVTDISVDFQGSALSISAQVNTIYGEVTINENL